MGNKRRLGLLIAALAFGIGAAPAQAEEPLSAIDWLSQSVDKRVGTPAGAAGATPPAPDGAATPSAAAPSAAALPSSASPQAQPLPGQPATAATAVAPSVTTSVIGAVSLDGVGLLAPRITGLPADLWGPGRSADIARAITAANVSDLPALQGLLVMLILAEARPPHDATPEAQVLLARIDKLLAFGALDQAETLIRAAGPTATPDLFRRAFDVALLQGAETEACAILADAPHLAPSLSARIFCLARNGDWAAAALVLETAEALGTVSAAEDALLKRFLDAEIAEEAMLVPPPSRPTPLIWRIYEAIGEPLPTTRLPLAFAQGDLTPQTGWKAQLEAAERLARAGGLPPNRLLGLYTERSPAASGGIWDRVEAFQDFEDDLTRGDAAAVAQSLPIVWEAMEDAELEVPFARLFAERLTLLGLEGSAGRIAFRVALLAPGYEAAARAYQPADGAEAFLAALARGNLAGVALGDSMARTIAPAFLVPEPDPTALSMQAEGRLGEALLFAIDRIARGVEGEPRGVAQGLAFLRLVGLEDVARRTALELMLLERRG